MTAFLSGPFSRPGLSGLPGGAPEVSEAGWNIFFSGLQLFLPPRRLMVRKHKKEVRI